MQPQPPLDQRSARGMLLLCLPPLLLLLLLLPCCCRCCLRTGAAARSNSTLLPALQLSCLQKMRREFEYWYPFDLRVSGKDLIQVGLPDCLTALLLPPQPPPLPDCLTVLLLPL